MIRIDPDLRQSVCVLTDQGFMDHAYLLIRRTCIQDPLASLVPMQSMGSRLHLPHRTRGHPRGELILSFKRAIPE